MQTSTSICIVIPTYNEKSNVVRLIDEIHRTCQGPLTLLFVDDSSPDGTANIIKEIATRDPSVKLLLRHTKKGIGSAYKDGFREALAIVDSDVIIQMDADFQHPPSAVPSLVKAIERGADVAIGSRYLSGGIGVDSNWELQRRLFSMTVNLIPRYLLGIGVSDATSGFRAYRREAAEIVATSSFPMTDGFEFQIGSLRLLRENKLVEVPYKFGVRKTGASKLGIPDLFRFIVGVISYSFH